MKKEKMVKIGLISMMMLILLLGTTCKKSDELEKDIDVIIALATQSISDINDFAASAANIENQKTYGIEKQAASACQPYARIFPIAGAIGSVANPSPEHGWISGEMGISVNADCSALMTIAAVIDCTGGATLVSGDTLGGGLGISGHIDAVENNIEMFMTESSPSFVVNGRSHNVFLNIDANGTLSAGLVTITGHIDGEQISITTSY